MDLLTKTVLYIDLQNKSFDIKSQLDLSPYIGGVGIGLKLSQSYRKYDPVVFAVGPLNGFFPFVSKTCIVLNNEGVTEDIYLGGSLSSRMRFAGIDAIAFCNKSDEPIIIEITDHTIEFKDANTDIYSLGLPGKRSLVYLDTKKLLLDEYFTTPDTFLERKLVEKNIKAISITGSKVFEVENNEKYEEIYKFILKRIKDITVKKDDKPSCAGCPMGCAESKTGEMGGNILNHSLVACNFAQNIYADVGIVFACLNTLGQGYTHEDIENLPKFLESTLPISKQTQLTI